MSDTKVLSDILQCKTVDYAKAVEVIEAFRETLVQHRSQASFDEVWNETLDLYQRSDIYTAQQKPKMYNMIPILRILTMSYIRQGEY